MVASNHKEGEEPKMLASVVLRRVWGVCDRLPSYPTETSTALLDFGVLTGLNMEKAGPGLINYCTYWIMLLSDQHTLGPLPRI